MAVQTRSDNTTEPLILSDDSLVSNGVITQEPARTTDLLQNTVMAKIAATGYWVPFNALVGTDGSGVPRGIYLGDDIAAADLVAGDIDDCAILVGNATVNGDLVVWDDDTLRATSIVALATVEARTAADALIESAGIFLEDTVAISEYEN